MSTSFVLHKDSLSILEEMTDEQAGIFIKSIYHYRRFGTLPELDFGIEMAVTPFINQLVRDAEKSRLGKHHWNWKGGISPKNNVIRQSLEMKQWKKYVFLRDKYTCQKCLKIGGQLHAHHIKPFAKYIELRFDVDNGLTLCPPCHHKEHSKCEIQQ